MSNFIELADIIGDELLILLVALLYVLSVQTPPNIQDVLGQRLLLLRHQIILQSIFIVTRL